MSLNFIRAKFCGKSLSRGVQWAIARSVKTNLILCLLQLTPLPGPDFPMKVRAVYICTYCCITFFYPIKALKPEKIKNPPYEMKDRTQMYTCLRQFQGVQHPQKKSSGNLSYLKSKQVFLLFFFLSTRHICQLTVT